MDDIDTIEEGQGGHSLFAPSASAGWLACADYLAANAGKGDSAGFYAAEGTVFHAIMTDRIELGYFTAREGDVEKAEAGGIVHEVEVTSEMLAHAEDCARIIEKLYQEASPADLYTERRVDFSDLTPIARQGGTCDVAICSPGKLIIRDYKYGRGVRVDAENNPQLMLYAYGFFREWDWAYGFQRINIGILQPRLERFDEHEFGREELLAFAEMVRERAALAWEALKKGGIQRTPSPKACQWCGSRALCPARASLLESMVDETFEDLEAEPKSLAVMEATTERLDGEAFEPRIVPAAELTTAQLARLLRWRRDVESWFKDVEAELLRRAEDGDETPGWKLVEGRTRRKWRDEQDAERLLVKLGLQPNEFYTLEAISVSAAQEKLKRVGIGRKRAADLLAPVVVKPPGRPTLVPLFDNRPQLQGHGDDFEIIEDDEL